MMPNSSSGLSYHSPKLVDVSHGAGETFTAVFDNGTRFRASLSHLPLDGVAGRCLYALAMTLPMNEFFQLHANFLVRWSQRGFTAANLVELDCFLASLADLLQLPHGSFRRDPSRARVPDSNWQQMSRARSRTYFEDDPAFAKLDLPEATASCDPPAATSSPHPLIAPVLNTLHLIGEDSRLNTVSQHALMKLVPVICELALLVRPEWADYWKRFCPQALEEWPTSAAAGVLVQADYVLTLTIMQTAST
jgi:anaphase-promoting complex subunit 1